MRFAILLALVGPRPFCRPAIDPGPVRADMASAPVAVQVLTTTDADRITAVVRAGSAFDPAGREGIAALTALQVAEAATGCADLSVNVGLELVTFSAEATEDCSSSLARALVHPAPLTQLDLDARTQALLEASPDVIPDLSAQLVRERVYRAHPYGHAAAGRASVVETVTDIELSAFHTQHYVRATTAVAVSSAGDGESLRSAVTEPLLGLPTTLAADAPRQSPLLPEGRSFIVASSKTLPPTAAAGHALALTPDSDDWPVWVDAVAAFNGAQVADAAGHWALETGPAVGWNTQHPMLLLTVRPTSHDTTAAALLGATRALEAWAAQIDAQADTNPDRVRDLLGRVVSLDALTFAVVTDRNDRFEHAPIEENDDSTVYTRLGVDEGRHHTVQAQGLYR